MSKKQDQKPKSDLEQQANIVIAAAIMTYGSDAETNALLKELGGNPEVLLNLPPFVKPDAFPVGGTLIARVKKVIGDFTGDPDMAGSQNLILVPQTKINGVWTKQAECMLPMTGVIRQSMIALGKEGAEGKLLAFIRKPDVAAPNRANQIMYNFSIILLDSRLAVK